MASFDVDALLVPLSGDHPCGDADLEYDDTFLMLEEAARGRPEQQYGDTVIPAEDPDWARMRGLALTLFGRTRDLRVAMHLIRAGLRTEGLGALADGLRLLHGLLADHWEAVWPRLDADDGNDPFARLNALAPLNDPTTVLADVRAARLPGDRTGVTGRMLELASGRAQADAGESVPVAASLAGVLRQGEAQHPGLIAGLGGLPAAVDALDALLSARVGADAPEFKPLRQVARALADATQAAVGGGEGAPAGEMAAAAGVPGAAGGPVAVAAAAGVPGAIASRDDAIRTLERVCEWIERHEPSNPAPLLIRRAQRLMRKNFFEIIRDLAPDGLDAVERIAGISYDEATGG